MNCISFMFTPSCCIVQRHSSLHSSRSCASSTLTARILDLFDIQPNLLTLAPHRLTNCSTPTPTMHYVSHDVTCWQSSPVCLQSNNKSKVDSSKISSHLLEITGNGLQFYNTDYNKTELFKLTSVLDQSSKTKGLISGFIL